MSDRDIVTAFAAARKAETPLVQLPETETPGLKRAFDLQCAITKELGWEQIGWKIGCSSEHVQKALNATGPFPGTMFRHRLYKSGDHFPTRPENMRVVEPEVAFTMAKSLPPRGSSYSRDEVLGAAASVHVAIEVVNPRTPNRFKDPVNWFIVDGGLNEGIVMGDARKLLSRDQFASLKGQVLWNSREMQGGIGSNALGGGDLVLTWIANHLNEYGLGLNEGDIITTGVITGFFSAGLGDAIEVNFEHLGQVTLAF